MKYQVSFEDRTFDIRGHQPTEYIASYFARGEFYELPLLTHLRSRYGTLPEIVDVGANVGNHTVFFREFMGAHVTAFEPNHANFLCLERNAVTATVHELALGAADGTVASVPLEGNMGASYCVPGGAIPVRTLDSFNLSPGLVKIDAENMEADVIRGAAETIRAHRPILVVEHNDLSHLYAFNRALADIHPYHIHPFVTPTWEMFIYEPGDTR